MIITSVQNSRVKEVVRLRQRRERDKIDLFIIEGYREILRATESNVEMGVLYICPSLFLGSNESTLIEKIQKRGTEVVECSEDVFKKISYRDRPDGLLAVAPQIHQTLNDILLSNNPFVIIAEAIEKPGNLGTILRSSDAVGLDGVIVCDRCTDIHNPNVVRASIGTLFTVPVVETTRDDTLHWLKEHQITLVAATPQAKEHYTDVDLTGPVAIAVGTEQLGLSNSLLNESAVHVRIPMMGQADSLNVATATTLLLYEVLRQRRSCD